MRGRIIQYNGADGSGTIVAEGRQYPFVLTAWRGDSAPAVNKTVDITFDGDAVSAITTVGDDVLLKERAAEFGGKLGASWDKLRASIPVSAGAAAGAAATPLGSASSGAAAHGAPADGAITANAIIERYGKLMLGTWVLFLIGTLAFNAISMSMLGQSMGKSLFDIASAMSRFGTSGGGMIKVLLLLGYASIALPLFWRDRRAWFALLVPLIAVLWAIFSVLHTLHSIGSQFGQDVGDLFGFGFGFYLSLATAIVLAVLGVKRGLRAA
ncbi:MAG: hypothetical protein EPN38_11375 [Rhodanobacteraceae bacterium]|nr:MAG: hypothetical protein EPN38_11375 [Rhodanobacteraceae bacterium]